MKKMLITLAAMIAFIALAASAQAYTLTWDSYTASGVTVTAHGGNLITKTTAGYGGLGVDGPRNAEIGTGEDITFEFTDASQNVSSLSLSMLYSIVSYDDNYSNEIAKVTISSGGTDYVYTLTVNDGGLTATWADVANASSTTITALSPGTEGNGGVWTILNPFGSLAVDSIILTAIDNGAGNTGANSDYCFYAMTTAPTPIPGAVWLLGSGLLGLVGLRKFRG